VTRRTRLTIAPDPAASAEAARLRYVTDARPGIRRVRAGKHFRYVAPGGRPVRDPADLRRIRRLTVPPAWTDVWIAPDPRGHLQATGRDARRRKQYRYHPHWRAVRDDTKYGRLLAFGRVLPRVRVAVARDLALRGLPREKVLATVVRLLDSTALRVGNGEYARQNGSFGLTTMRNGHAAVSGATVRFQFRGKGGKLHQADVRDRRVARVIRRCQELPGQELFQYLDAEGRTRTIDSADVNAYLRALTGQGFTAKDFRTWAGTVLATVALGEQDPARSPRHGRRSVSRAIGTVAARLGNTPAICRKSYVHPGVIEAYADGSLVAAMARRGSRSPRSRHGGLRPEEACVLALLASRVPVPAARAA
jgi:DNA topoisomerase-1